MKNKKAEMGIGTLILFIAFILVAAVAASVLISTTSSLQSKALSTGKATTAEVGTSMTAVEVYSEDASDNSVDKTVDYFYYSIKLSSGSDPIRFTDVLLTLNTNNQSRDYTYSNTFTRTLVYTNSTGTECNASDINYTSTAATYYVGACSAWPTVTYPNATYYNATGSLCANVTNSTGDEISTNENTTTTTSFTTNYGISYSLSSSQKTEGYIFPGDVVKLCFTAPRAIGEAEEVKFNLVPKIGSTLTVDTTMPSLMRDKRIYVYP